MGDKQPTPAGGAPSLPFPEYFTQLAQNYGHFTGNSTRDLFRATIPDLPPITPESYVHDNAAGPGTAASGIVDFHLDSSDQCPRIVITDSVDAMVSVAAEKFKPHSTISTQVLDSHDLSTISSDSLTHSILNFSIFTFADPVKCLKEIHRTLRPGGTAAIITWKRFGVGDIIHAAQKRIRPDLPVMMVPGAQFMQREYLTEKVKEAWDVSTPEDEADKCFQVLEKAVVLVDADLQGTKDFMLSGFTGPARRGYSEEDAAKWPNAVEEALNEEVAANGGLRMEAWAVLVKK